MPKMTQQQFADLLSAWAGWWERLHDAGEEGFEDIPRELADWLGSVDAYDRLHRVMSTASVDVEVQTGTPGAGVH